MKAETMTDDFELPEADVFLFVIIKAEALSEVENALNDGSPTDDIAKKLAENMDKVNDVLRT